MCLAWCQYNGFGGSQIQSGGGNFPSPSQGMMNQFGGGGGSGSGAAKKRDPQSLTRLTIKQCNEAVEINGKYHVDDRQIQQVNLLANVLTVQIKETHVELSVEDGTGTILVRMYLDNMESEQVAAIREGEYQVIIGTIKKTNNVISFVAYSIVPVQDHNMITMHLLDTILTHQRATLGPAKSGGGAAAAAAPGGYAKQEGVVAQPQYGASVPAPAGGASLRDQVLHLFQHGAGSENEVGCSVQYVVDNLPGVTMQQVREVVDQLSNVGFLLYSTIDEDHYKTTSS